VQEDGYETDPTGFTQKADTIIQKLVDRGLYANIDWHQLSPGDPMVNLSMAKTYFTHMATKWGHLPNVTYEICNEPSGVSWARIKDYANQIIPVIRAIDPDGVILVGTRAWSSLGVSDGMSSTSGPNEIINNPVNFPNLMYVFHMYAASHKDEYRAALSYAADNIPMFVTEWGTQTYTGGGGNDFTSSQQYIDLMKQKKISWINWNYSHDPLSGAAFKEGVCPNGPFTGTSPLKPAGVWIRDQLRLPDDFPTQ
jgi:endoglucanase